MAQRRETNPGLFASSEAKARLEARNGLLQFDLVQERIRASFDGGQLQVTPELLCDLHEVAIRDLYPCAGRFRDGPVGIAGTQHQPPPPDEVSELVEEMCLYANSSTGSALHVSAYLMWRLNWIHPFAGGNGRCSRAISYYALSVRLGILLPGTNTIPEQITTDRSAYYAALDAADAAWKAGAIDVSGMETLMAKMLVAQMLMKAFEPADPGGPGGKESPAGA